jgi:sigma-B regulation protein RsbU (phosphoserine phosphatase)
MSGPGGGKDQDPRFHRMILEDIRRSDLKRTYRRDLRDLYHFYLDDEARERLGGMSRIKRWFLLSLWLVKSLIRNLSPARRVLVLASLVLYLVAGISITSGDMTVDLLNLRRIAFLLLLFVLMLELRDKLLARNELAVGRAVQLALLPEDQPRLEGWDIWLYTRPANDVGGDLVDYLAVGAGRLGLALGDVSGKGLGAALLMSKLQATLRALATEGGDSLADLGARVNAIFCRDHVPGRYTTLAYLEIDSASGAVRLLNAGHLPPVVVRRSAVEEMGPVAPPIGLLPDAVYEEQRVELQEGEAMIVYSDGVTEARDEEGAFFGEERFLSLLPGLGSRPAPAEGKRILDAVEVFVGEERLADDLSVIILRRI